ncbi:MAG: hypothetical protein ACK4HG_00310 [Agrobacterium albertimagni]
MPIAGDVLLDAAGGNAPFEPGKPDMTAQPPAEPRARLAEIDDAMASIKTQIASADLLRQASGKPIDPRWFHRAKTALRHLQRERAGLAQQPRPRRETVKDCLIAMLRERHDETTWSGLVAEAHQRADREGL